MSPKTGASFSSRSARCIAKDCTMLCIAHNRARGIDSMSALLPSGGAGQSRRTTVAADGPLRVPPLNRGVRLKVEKNHEPALF